MYNVTAQVREQHKMDSVLMYLGKHGQHVENLALLGDGPGLSSGRAALRQLPPTVKLNSLQLSNIKVQLQPGNGFDGVLGAGAADLKMLRVIRCDLFDDQNHANPDGDLALSQLPAGLEHLCLYSIWRKLPTHVLAQLQQLTYLELCGTNLQGPDTEVGSEQDEEGGEGDGEEEEEAGGEEQRAVTGEEDGKLDFNLHPLQALPHLADLRFNQAEGLAARITAADLSANRKLMRLECDRVDFEPSALSGKTQLQHLSMYKCTISGGAAGVARMMAELSHIQLTHLHLIKTMEPVEEGNPPASAYAALTASSKLQYLNIANCELPTGAWQHMYAAGRQLPQLQTLDISCVFQAASRAHAPYTGGTTLVSCCPGLTRLWLDDSSQSEVQHSTDLLTSLQKLSGLHTLSWSAHDGAAVERLPLVCQLTGLRELAVSYPGFGGQSYKEGLLLQLTQLKQLTRLCYVGPAPGLAPGGPWPADTPAELLAWLDSRINRREVTFTCEVSYLTLLGWHHTCLPVGLDITGCVCSTADLSTVQCLLLQPVCLA
jgi:hypothetical protein